jgi:hypothetical protein
VDSTELFKCFTNVEVGHYRDNEGYGLDWYDQSGGVSYVPQLFYVTIPKQQGDLYIMAEMYDIFMIPPLCHWNQVPMHSLDINVNKKKKWSYGGY